MHEATDECHVTVMRTLNFIREISQAKHSFLCRKRFMLFGQSAFSLLFTETSISIMNCFIDNKKKILGERRNTINEDKADKLSQIKLHVRSYCKSKEICILTWTRQKSAEFLLFISLPSSCFELWSLAGEEKTIHRLIQTLPSRGSCCAPTCPFTALREREQNKYAMGCSRSADLQQ